ncbi:MAG: type II secretion system protein [Verrucomicrobiota bacterium]
MNSPSYDKGFSIIEILIAVMIIGILSVLSMPALQRARDNSLVASFANDIRQFSSAVNTYAMEQGQYPPDAAPGKANETLKTYLPTGFMDKVTPIGGLWDIDIASGAGYAAAVGVGNLSSPDIELIVRIDFAIDDGNIVTGDFRWLPFGGGRPYLIIEE